MALIIQSSVFPGRSSSTQFGRISEEVSDLIGQATFKAETENSERLIQRPLVTPEDLRNMDYRKQIVLARTRNVEKAPMHLWQPRYFLRPDCKKHADPNPYIIA
ncbi:type IV secretory system conjugative DNA transfer family protein [Labrenzia sp. THAF82]|uniref:type IV secretory system conjugative DNA transfer family protein n=1 Tax=Labrenzia sp. THAF82 TaxID=2587861 RepID=UPI001268DFE3